MRPLYGFAGEVIHSLVDTGGRHKCDGHLEVEDQHNLVTN